MYIPAESSKALELKTAVVHADTRGEGDQLPDMLAPVFSTGKVDAAALHCSPHIKQLSEGAGLSKTLSADSFKKMGGSTETFRLAAGKRRLHCVLFRCMQVIGNYFVNKSMHFLQLQLFAGAQGLPVVRLTTA